MPFHDSVAPVFRSGRVRRGLSLRRLLNAVGSWFPASAKREAVTTAIRVEDGPEAVWRALHFYEEVVQRPGWLLRVLLPKPLRSEGEKTRVGATVRCVYEEGYLLKRITEAEPGRLLRFDVVEQRLGIENCVAMAGGSYEIHPVGAATDVRLTTSYSGSLRPRWLCRRYERLVAHRVHRHILGGMRELLRGPARAKAAQSSFRGVAPREPTPQ